MADRRLKVFYTVARLLSFTKAAETLQMSQPAVTFQVRQLEKHFSTELFDRSRNKIEFTEAGRRAFDYAERMFEMYDEMERAIKELNEEVSGVMLIGASSTLAESFLPAMLGQFKQRFPAVQLCLKVANTESIINLVETNMIDVGLVEGPIKKCDLVSNICKQENMALIVANEHPLAQQQHITPNELLSYPWINRESGSSTRELVERYLNDNDVNYKKLNTVLELGSPEAVKRAVEANMGIAIMPMDCLEKELSLQSLKALPLEPTLTTAITYVYKKQKFHLRALEELVSFTQQYTKEYN